MRAAVAEVCPISAEEWLDGFQRDQHPEREVVWWERVARSLLHGLYREENLAVRTKAGGFQGHLWFVRGAGSERCCRGCSRAHAESTVGLKHIRLSYFMCPRESVVLGRF